MKSKTLKTLLILFHVLVVLGHLSSASAQGTAFTYQGRLTDGPDGSGANGSYDFTFTLFGAGTGGEAKSLPFARPAVGVTNGLFTVTLDFGGNAFPGGDRWLEISVATNGSDALVTLSPRQRVTAAPYAITAGTVTGLVPGAGLAGSYGSAVGFSNPANVFNGSFSGNGAGLTNLNTAALGVWSTGGNAATTPGANFLGTLDNRPLEIKANGLRAARVEFAGDSQEDPDSLPDGAPNVILGAPVNFVAAGAVGTTIAGGGTTNFNGHGFSNSVLSSFGAIGGGMASRIAPGSTWGTIAGGNGNSIGLNASAAAIGGGTANIIGADAAVSSIVGGTANTVGMGSIASAIGGGSENDIGANSSYSTVGGGAQNLAASNASYTTIAGGHENLVGGRESTVSGGAYNRAFGTAAVVGGGGGYDSILGYPLPNGAHADWSTVSGGASNTVYTDAIYGTIGGGFHNRNSALKGTISGGGQNTIGPNAICATIAGGADNTIQDGAVFSTISGGVDNKIESDVLYGAIGGGTGNVLQRGNYGSSIGGGFYNSIEPNTLRSTIGGGHGNRMQSRVERSTIGGGEENTVQSAARFATIGGGRGNTCGGRGSAVPGGEFNTALGDHSFAAGYGAKANHPGSFVWGDSTAGNFASAADNEFAIRARGGVRLSPDTPSLSFGNQTRQMLNLWGTAYGIGVQAYTTYFRADGSDPGLNGFAWYQGGVHSEAGGDAGPGGSTLMRLTGVGLVVNGTFVGSSDRNAKENFQAVDARVVLQKVAALSLSEWSYKQDPSARHIGPMAQDFYAAFQVGPDDKHIATVDADGVALAAIQGLNQKMEELSAQIQELKRTVAELKQVVTNLAGVPKGGAR